MDTKFTAKSMTLCNYTHIHTPIYVYHCSHPPSYDYIYLTNKWILNRFCAMTNAWIRSLYPCLIIKKRKSVPCPIYMFQEGRGACLESTPRYTGGTILWHQLHLSQNWKTHTKSKQNWSERVQEWKIKGNDTGEINHHIFQLARSRWKSAVAMTSSATGVEGPVGGHEVRNARNLLQISVEYIDEDRFGRSTKLRDKKLPLGDFTLFHGHFFGALDNN